MAKKNDKKKSKIIARQTNTNRKVVVSDLDPFDRVAYLHQKFALSLLKSLRKEHKLTIQEAISALRNRGCRMNKNTYHSWERGEFRRLPDYFFEAFTLAFAKMLPQAYDKKGQFIVPEGIIVRTAIISPSNKEARKGQISRIREIAAQLDQVVAEM